ncbi:MAG TPA: hypothetical protein VGD59_12800 [Acidisarcina sp.]
MSVTRVNIDRLVLRGIAPGDRKHLVEALRGELSRMLSDPQTCAAWVRSQRIPVVRLGNIAFTPGPAGSRRMGREIASRITNKVRP